MIRSMTGFGRAEFQLETVSFVVEIRSVNHRHLDVRLRLPRPFAALEADLRNRIRQRFARGKLDVVVSQPGGETLDSRVRVDLGAAARYLEAAAVLERSHGVAGQLDVATLLALPGVASFEEPDLERDALLDSLRGALDEASAAVIEMRATEGAALYRDLSTRLARVSELVEALAEQAADVLDAVRERFRKRMQQLAQETGLTDQSRIYQELSLATDRMDISEELVRLRSHVDQFRDLLDAASDSVGRRLDFLLQEMTREANTVGAKGSHAPIAHGVVELKGELERIREQVQNVE